MASQGAVLTHGDRILSTGYSRELPGNTHAEECCFIKLSNDSIPWKECTLYTTMEPCSKRLSGKPACAGLVLERRVGRVVVGVAEPPHFVVCEGIDMLRAGDVAVDRITSAELIDRCRSLNEHITTPL